MRRLLRLLPISTLAIALLLAFSARTARAEDDVRAHDDVEATWTGTFVYAGGPSERRAIERAIEEATADMNALVRRFARHRLADKTEPDRRIVIRMSGREIGIAAGLLWQTPVDGTERVLRDSEGDAYRVAQRVVGRRIFQQIRDDDLVIHNVFSLSEDGSRLAIRVRVKHERIPEPLSYVLTYRRAS